MDGNINNNTEFKNCFTVQLNNSPVITQVRFTNLLSNTIQEISNSDMQSKNIVTHAEYINVQI